MKCLFYISECFQNIAFVNEREKVYHVLSCPHFVLMVLSCRLRLAIISALGGTWASQLVMHTLHSFGNRCMIHKCNVWNPYVGILENSKWNKRPAEYQLLWCICKYMKRERKVKLLSTKSCLTVLWPHGLLPARLLCPWNSPGKNTWLVSYSLLKPFLQEFSWPRYWTHVSCIGGRFFTVWANSISISSVVQSCPTLCQSDLSHPL